MCSFKIVDYLCVQTGGNIGWVRVADDHLDLGKGARDLKLVPCGKFKNR